MYKRTKCDENIKIAPTKELSKMHTIKVVFMKQSFGNGDTVDELFLVWSSNQRLKFFF